MSGNWGYLIKGPSSRQSVKAFKEQMQIGSAATKDTDDKRLKENHLRTIFLIKPANRTWTSPQINSKTITFHNI